MSPVKRLLIVDDDEMLCDSLLEQFSLNGEFDVQTTNTAGGGIRIATGELIDLVLLDVNLPDMDGRQACKVMRAEGYNGPVIMLTGQTADDDTIRGLDAGANDYIAKPFKFAVLLARIRVQLRQHEHSDHATFRIGHYIFRPSSKLLIRDDRREVRLTEKETAILKYLYRAGPEVVGREVLLHEVWGYSERVSTHTLETHVYRLRQKIERDPSRAEILLTESGGYRLNP